MAARENLDDVVLFKPLTLPEIERIVDLQTEDLRRRLADRKLVIELTEATRVFIARRGFDPVYCARPLKRYLQHEVESRVGRAIIAGEVTDGSVLRVDVEGGELTVKIEPPAEAETPEEEPVPARA